MPEEKRRSAWRETLRSFGPGIVTGAADDDPSGIATYSQVGAEHGYAILWSTVLSLPLMVAVQQITAEIGRVTGRGITHHMKRSFPLPLTAFLVVSVGVANVINIGADVAAMGAATRMLVGGPAFLYGVVYVLVSLALQVFIPYDRYAGILKWTTLVLFAYVATPFVVDVSWRDAFAGALWPADLTNTRMLTAVTAVLGTTISPYLLFWQASEEAEELAARKAKPLRRAPRRARKELRRVDVDTLIGMTVSNAIAFAIILTCAAALHAHGTTHVETPEQVAEALRPVAGRLAFTIFAVGIVGTGFLAVPVLAGATAYGIAELCGWRATLEARWHEAKAFYGVLAFVMLAGLAIAAAPISPIRALYLAAVLNGIAAVPAIVALLWIAGSARVMSRRFVAGGVRLAIGWLTAALMLAAAAGTIVGFFG